MDRDHSRLQDEAIDAVRRAVARDAALLVEPDRRVRALAEGRRVAAWLSAQPRAFWDAHASDGPVELRALGATATSGHSRTSGTGVAPGPVAEMLAAARRDLARLRCLDDRRVDAALAVYDAVADAWAERHHSTREHWYETHIAAIAVGGSHIGAGLPFDPEARVRGATQFLDSGLAIVYAFEYCDISTLAHEAAHLFRRDLEGEDLLTVERWLGVDGGRWEGDLYLAGHWTADAEERFARGFERYLLEGEPPTPELEPVFATIKRHLCRIYLTIEGSEVDIELGPVARRVFAKLLGGGGVERTVDRDPDAGPSRTNDTRPQATAVIACPTCRHPPDSCRCQVDAIRPAALGW